MGKNKSLKKAIRELTLEIRLLRKSIDAFYDDDSDDDSDDDRPMMYSETGYGRPWKPVDHDPLPPPVQWAKPFDEEVLSWVKKTLGKSDSD